MLAKKDPPYLHQNFNIFGFHQKHLSAVKGLARILNAFTEGLNTRPKLPKYVIMVPDKDMITCIDYFSFGATDVFEKCLTWILQQIDNYLARRETDLINKKPGALFGDSSPQIIWIRMLKRPYNGFQEFDQILALCNRFNNALESTLAEVPIKAEHLILSIKVDDMDFYKTGSLTPAGEANFWREVNECIHRFELDKINLVPRHQKKDVYSDNRRKLPTPPYVKKEIN